jgi:hypothetical protein
MRDFRDAKAMAQTLREALNAKSVSLTHSESLELIAKILGCRDWNALAAKIQSSSGQTDSPAALPPADNSPSSQAARQKVAVDAAILDDYAGFYQLGDNAVFTVTREADHLLTHLTGQRHVAFHAQSPTEFFTDVVDAQITFVRDERGLAASAILHQGGREPSDAAHRHGNGAADCKPDGREGEKPVRQPGDRGSSPPAH